MTYLSDDIIFIQENFQTEKVSCWTLSCNIATYKLTHQLMLTIIANKKVNILGEKCENTYWG